MTRICVFGDSIPWGADDREKGGWVDRFKVYFKNTGKFNEVFNLCNPGEKSTRLLEYIENECRVRLCRVRLELQYKKENIVIIQIGINDACLIKNKKPFTPPAQFKKNIQKLIDITKKFVGKVILVGITPVDESKTTPIPWDTDKSYKNEYIKKYDGIISSVCKERNIKFIEVFDRWIKLDYKNLLADGLHPNAKGHQKIFEIVKNFLIENKII